MKVRKRKAKCYRFDIRLFDPVYKFVFTSPENKIQKKERRNNYGNQTETNICIMQNFINFGIEWTEGGKSFSKLVRS